MLEMSPVVVLVAALQEPAQRSDYCLLNVLITEFTCNEAIAFNEAINDC